MPDRAQALAGVMGGRDSEVSAGTTTILLESARFDPLSVRKTARALAMKSDSSTPGGWSRSCARRRG